jgi:putative ABC transport system permease protein
MKSLLYDLLLAARLARRELRAGLRGFGVFVACLALGVAAVAGSKSLSAAYLAGVAEDAAALLGGDVEAALSLRPAAPEEQRGLAALGTVSHVVTMQTMARGQGDGAGRALASLKAVDGGYPLYGALELSPPMPLDEALGARNGLPGAVVAPELLARLGARLGDVVLVADVPIEIRATIVREPDAATGLVSLGPRLLVAQQALDGTGLVGPGMFTRHAYRIKLPPGADAKAAAAHLRDAYPKAGWRVRDLASAQPGLTRFMDRLGAVTGLVGLASLLLGGIGVSQAVAGYLGGREGSIAALKCLGAPRRVVVWTYLFAVAAQGCLGIAIGLAVGASLPPLVAPLAAGALPVRLPPGPYPEALALAAAFGALAVLAFSLPHLMQAGRVSPLLLFRGYAPAGNGRLPWRDALPGAIALAGLFALAVLATPNRRLGLGFVVAALGAAAIFRLLAAATVRLMRLAPLGRPGLGLGLSTLAAMTQVEANFRQAFAEDIPKTAPDYFFVDIQPGQLAAFLETAKGVAGVVRVDASPMIRGRVAAINGTAPEESRISEDVRWAVSGDRGLSFAAAMPEGTRLVEGAWWPPDYAGEPLVSVEEAVAKGIGVGVGDTVTVNVLGREITARISSLRRVNWLTLGINYVFVFSPGALDGLPATWLATAYTDKAAGKAPGEAVFAVVTQRFPSVTVVGIGDALTEVLAVADKVSSAVRAAAAATLGAGLLVLVQSLAAGLRRRAYETVIYKVCGATRRDVMTVLCLENALLGLLAGLVALAVGTAVSLGFTTYFMELPFSVFAGPAALVVAAATALTLVFGSAGAFAMLSRRALPYLRNE